MAFTVYHVRFYYHFGTNARGKGLRVSVTVTDSESPEAVAFQYLLESDKALNTLIDPSRTTSEEKASGRFAPIDLPRVFVIGKIPMDLGYGGSDGVASWSKRNSYLPIEPRKRL